MPGTIQVTVLEFKGFSSSSKPSAKSLKVWMGKRQFQTWDKGDFSFPITKLGEDLFVSLLDSGGNEIAHQDIRTVQIIEKGHWDEVFAINGGGHVHLKLRFVLSEEERHRVRLMRETAVKKKLETNPNIKLRLLQVSNSVETSTKNEQKISDSPKGLSDIDEVSPKVEGSQAGSSLASATSSANLSEIAIPVKELSVEDSYSDATDGAQAAPSTPDKHEVKSQDPRSPTSDKNNTVALKLQHDPPRSELSESPTSDKNTAVAPKLPEDDQTRSSVRKIISVLENTQIQEVKSLKKVSSVPGQLNRFRKATVLSDDQESKADKHTAEHIVPSDHGSSQQLSSTEKSIPSGENDVQKLKISAVDIMRQSTSETATSSGRMPEEQTQPYNEVSSNSINFNESSVLEGSGRGRGRGTSLKSSTIVVASNKRPTLEYYNEECYSGQSSGMWIFPDNTRGLCITTAGHKVAKTDSGEYITSKSNVLDKDLQNAMHETEFKTEKKTVDRVEAGSGRSPNGSSNGLVGQVIKIAVIVGFGVLVLLTRQKEPRKKHTENDNLFHVPEYI